MDGLALHENLADGRHQDKSVEAQSCKSVYASLNENDIASASCPISPQPKAEACRTQADWDSLWQQ
jgi:hypothetical protein